MANTDNLNMPEMSASQAQKHVTHNESLVILDAIVQLSVIDRGLTTPPGSPVAGDRYIVATSGTGDWSGHDGKIAAYQNGAWEIYDPQEGWRCYLEDEDILIIHDGTNWVNPNFILELLGVGGAAPDSTNKLSVNSDAILFNHNGSDSQMKVNKNAVGDTASLLFQTAFISYAEMGLNGSNDWSIKASDDGSTWFTALAIDGTDGSLDGLAATFTALTCSGDMDIETGTLALSGNAIGGESLLISDDAVGEFVPPRKGGFAFFTWRATEGFADQTRSGLFFYDVGSSPLISLNSGFSSLGSNLAVVVTDVTGTDGTDGDVTIAVQTGVVKVENRSGLDRTGHMTWL